MPSTGLSRYQAKRDFRITPEPRGRVAAKAGTERGYLIQKHAASHLHYDFRLELNGVLLSWAVPKGPSLDPADKRLAMHVEDHPLEYGGFEGTIPKGQYGGGTVMLWDRGTWVPVGDPEAGYEKGHLKFDLHGQKLKGRWALVKTRGSKYGGKADAWLLIKDTDDHARRGVDARVVDAEPDSALSGRTMDEIAAGSNEWHSNRSAQVNVTKGAPGRKAGAPKATAAQKKAATSGAKKKGESAPALAGTALPLADIAGTRKAALPKTLPPALATLVASAPEGEDWVHEVKFDGYRMLCRLQNGKAMMLSRNGKDWTERFPAVLSEMRALKARDAWIDGELCALDDKGRSRFQDLQNALSAGSEKNLVYFAFDLLHLDGYDLRGVALRDRKRLLEDLLSRSETGIQFSPDVRGSGREVFKQACASGLEGIVSKRADSAYDAGLRTRNWVKTKCSLRQEMVIGGFTDPRNSRAGFGALLLGIHEDGKLRYAGKVGTGFDDKLLVALRKRLDRMETKAPPFVNPPRGYEAKGAHWVKPELVAEIEFTEWSEAGALRHPAFLALREDKQAAEVVRERPAAVSATVPAGDSKTSNAKASASKTNGAKSATAEKTRSRKPVGKAQPSTQSETVVSDSGKAQVAGIALSHPDKQLFPEAGLTKLDLAKYYEAVADWILPHVKNRPLSLVRCPDGWSKQCFYQKHANASVNAAVTRVEVPEGGGKATYFSADSLPALVSLVQWGVVELHPWGSRMPHPEKPDRLILDFDPADDVAWPQVVEAVQMTKALLENLGLRCFLKTTGGKGLHVVVPIKPTLTWAQAKAFTKAIADTFAKTLPDRFTATVSKAKRNGRIFIDYLRNAEGATAIAPFGIRARTNASVSTPISWKELSVDVRFDYFNVRTVPARLRRMRSDPWKDFAQTRQTVTQAMLRKAGLDMPKLSGGAA